MSIAGGDASRQSTVEEPRFEDGRATLVAGYKQRFTGPDVKNISLLWQRFAPHIGKTPGQVGQLAYGLCSNMNPSPFSFESMAGVEVSGPTGLPTDFSVTSIPAMRYVIFTHHGSVSNISKTIDAIFQQWLPNSGKSFLQPTPDVPYMIERYDERFDPQTASGDVELWIPVRV